MATNTSWREWIQAQDTYTPQFEYGKAIGQALENFEASLLSQATSVFTIRADRSTGEVRNGRIDYNDLLSICRENVLDQARFEFFFVNRFLIKDISNPEPPDAHKLRISADALRLLASRYYMSPGFLQALSRFYLPNRRGFRHYDGPDGKVAWNQWFFLPFRVQVPCTDKQRSHATSTTGSNQMNPFHYLHLPDEEVDIRGSQIALYICHDSRVDTTTVICFNYMDGRWPKIVEEPQTRILEALKHPNVAPEPILVHLVCFTTIVRWWNHTLHSVNEQLITYEKRLQEDIDDGFAANNLYNDICKTLHAMAAHVHRYGTELDSLEDTSSELTRVFSSDGQDSASLADIEEAKSHLRATNAFVREQEKKIQNILALLFNRMQITNDRMMVFNGKAMHAILKATQEEAAISRDIALRSQQISEDMKKDSVSMKTIAILTLFFLPGTSFSAVLAMPFFTTNTYLTNARHFWIWIALTVPTTAIAYAVYHFWRQHDEKRESNRHEDLETRNNVASNYYSSNAQKLEQ